MKKYSKTSEDKESVYQSYKESRKFYLIIIFILLAILTFPLIYAIKDFVQWVGCRGENKNLYKLILCLFVTILIFLYLLIRNNRDSNSSNFFVSKGIMTLLVILNFGVIFFPSHYSNDRLFSFKQFFSKENTNDYENVSSKNAQDENDENIVAMSDSTAVDSNGNEIHSDGNETEKVTEKKQTQSELVSIDAYKEGYSDGQMAYGLPDSETATADESYMAHGYNFSSADITVYKMGYNDGMYGRTKQY